MKLRIREIRTELGLSQQELANRAKCSRQFINMLENDDDIDVGSKLLVSIAQALEVTVDELISFETGV